MLDMECALLYSRNNSWILLQVFQTMSNYIFQKKQWISHRYGQSLFLGKMQYSKIYHIIRYQDTTSALLYQFT